MLVVTTAYVAEATVFAHDAVRVASARYAVFTTLSSVFYLSCLENSTNWMRPKCGFLLGAPTFDALARII